MHHSNKIVRRYRGKITRIAVSCIVYYCAQWYKAHTHEQFLQMTAGLVFALIFVFNIFLFTKDKFLRQGYFCVSAVYFIRYFMLLIMTSAINCLWKDSSRCVGLTHNKKFISTWDRWTLRGNYKYRLNHATVVKLYHPYTKFSVCLPHRVTVGDYQKMKRLSWRNTAFLDARIKLWLQRNLKEDQSRAEWVRFQMFLAWRTVELKSWRVEVNSGLDLDLRLLNLVITGACLSSKEDTVVVL